MTDMGDVDEIDLIEATRAAVNQALNTRVAADTASVWDSVPQDARPPFLKVGTVTSEDEAQKGGEVERLTVEIIGVYQGEDRERLAAMMFAAKRALNGRDIEAEGAAFQPPRWMRTALSDVSPEDGITYVAMSQYEIYAEPA